MKLAWLLWMASWMAPVAPHLASQTCLATTVYLEARGEPQIGQAAVAEVALRRREMGLWGKHVCEVVTAPKQFAPSLVPPGTQLDNLQSWQLAWTVAGRALHEWSLPRDRRRYVVPHAMSFYAADIPAPSWATGSPLAVIGDHRFYAVN
ncbi:cell wall hydrolase [Metallibacterium scheffleri]